MSCVDHSNFCMKSELSSFKSINYSSHLAKSLFELTLCSPAAAAPYCGLLRYGEYGTTDNHGVAHIVADVLYQALCLVGQGRLMCLGLGHNLVRWRICSKPPPSCGTTHYLIRSMWSILGGNQGTNFTCQNIGQFVDHFWSIL